jgi:hypothetical protein
MTQIYFRVLFKISFLFSFVLLCAPLHAQRIIQQSVHFQKNKSILTSDAKEILDGIQDSIGDYVIDKIVIKGYTDSDADSAYNAKLSEQRCQSVKNYLVDAGIEKSKFYIAAYGEYFPVAENSNENNKSKNRRVDLIITMHIPVIVKKISLKDTCTKDTLIEVSDGVMMMVNKCRYQDKSNCMTVTVERREEYDLKFSSFKMKLGMKNYYTKENKRVIYYAHVKCEDTTCGDDGRVLYIPTYEVGEKKVSVTRYDSVQDKYVKEKTPKVKSVKKKSYALLPLNCHPGAPYEYILVCGGTQDVGFIKCGCKPSKMKFKDGIKILEAETYFEDETISADSSTLFFYPNCGISKLVLLDGSDTVKLENVQISAIHHGLRKTKNCKDEKWLLFIKFHSKCDAYRKYKFRRSDILFQKSKPWLNETSK